MLSEMLQISDTESTARWQSLMPGVEICCFTLGHHGMQLPILPSSRNTPRLEALFCCSGAMEIGQENRTSFLVKGQELFLVSEHSPVTYALVQEPVSGVLISVEDTSTCESLQKLYQFLGDFVRCTEEIRQQMQERHGYLLLHSTPWSRAVFSVIETLSPEEQAKYCLLKTLEVLYLLSTKRELSNNRIIVGQADSYLLHTVTKMQNYMAQHLDEKLTIETMCRRFHISATAFKSSFRRLNGQPVHRWLQQQRLSRAAELLRTTSMTVLQVAQAVGYEGISQFNVSFKRQYGITPGKYRKMSNSVEF